MTMYGIPYLRVCVNCGDEFAPIEGNDEADFCSLDCEDEYSEKMDAAAEVFEEDYGRRPPWLNR